ncbi:MAG: 4-hydroxythreonine-4-phosphate dehydrogenase PdxA [Salibacteraceae bacterium]
MANTEKIKVAITSGDVNGVGLEVALKAFTDSRVLDSCTPIIYASKTVVQTNLDCFEIPEVDLFYTDSIDSIKLNKVNVIETWTDNPVVEFGKLSNKSGEAAFLSLKCAVEDLASNKTDVMVTLPINKASIQSDDFNFPGHTEFLADYANEEHPLMILAHDGLRVALVSGHLALRDVSSTISEELILKKLDVFSKSLTQDFGITRPRIAVLGLNPHNGDHGLLGDEEQLVIEPSIKTAQEAGILAFGPFAADGFFGSSTRANFDGVLAMYHDQGLAPFKALSFGSGVNYTAGLPIVRTSPDHGTAFDIAGKGMADASSFRSALRLACDIYSERKMQRQLAQNALQSNLK